MAERRKPGPKLKPGPRTPSGALVDAPITGIPGAGGYKAARVVCIHGHLALDPRPDKPGLRQCRTCARARANEQKEAIRQARRCLGLTHRAFTGLYGMSTTRALALAEECQRQRGAGTTA